MSNEELKRSESLALAQAKALYGPETQKIIEAQIKLGQAQREAALFKDKNTAEAKRRGKCAASCSEKRRPQSSETLTGTQENAAIDAADALGEARGKRAKQLFGKDQGINQFLSGSALGAAPEEGIRLQKAESKRLFEELRKSFTQQGNFAAARQLSNAVQWQCF